MRKKTMLSMAAIILLCGLFVPGIGMTVAKAEDTIHWKFNCDWPATDLQMAEAIPRFPKWVERASKGRFKISAYSGGQLVPPSESFDNLRRGTFEMLQSCGAYHGGKVPVGMPSFQLPMGPRGIYDFQKIYWDYGGFDLVHNTYKKLGVLFMATTPFGGANLCSKKPLRTLDDFKGIKLRTVGPQGTLWKELGAAVVNIPGGELYLALQTGVVDAFTWTNQAVDKMKMSEVTKYMICPYPPPFSNGTGTLAGGLYVNEKAFNKLPPDLQIILVRCIQQLARYSSMIYDEWDRWFVEGGVKELGMEIITLSKEDTMKMRKLAMEKVWPKFAKDEPSKQFIEIVKQFLKDQGEL